MRQGTPFILFHKQLKIFLRWSCLCLFLLSDFNVAQNTQAPRLERRFMWKHMDSTMDGLISSVNTGTQAVKNMIGEFLPLVQTTPSTNDFATSTTTRIKYIIKKPTPMKIIKIRAPMKITKILTLPTTMTTTTTSRHNKINKFNELYTESLAKNNANLYATNSLKALPNFNQSALKASAMSKLHTNIMQDDRADDHIDEDDIAMDSSLHVNKFYKKPKSHTYEVVENIVENEANAFAGLVYTSKQPLTVTASSSVTDAPIITTTTTHIGRHKKLRDQKLLTTPDTFSITDSWQPSVGFQAASLKPQVVWRHENWPSIESSVGEAPAITSSIATYKDKPKRRKNHHTQKRLKVHHEQEQEQEQVQAQPELTTKTTTTTNTLNKRKRGSVKFGDRIN